MGHFRLLFVYFRSFQTIDIIKTVDFSGIRTQILGVEGDHADRLVTTTTTASKPHQSRSKNNHDSIFCCNCCCSFGGENVWSNHHLRRTKRNSAPLDADSGPKGELLSSPSLNVARRRTVCPLWNRRKQSVS